MQSNQEIAYREPLLILHLSDLHFGEHSRFKELKPEELGKRLHEDVKYELNRRGIKIPVSLVVVTGDVAQTARPKEYEQAKNFLASLSEGLKLDPQRFVFVPGNHDVSWAMCKMLEEVYDENELRRRIDEKKFQFFDEFLKQFYEIPRSSLYGNLLAHSVFVYNFKELTLSVAALNSCEVESHRKEDHWGLLSKEQAQALMNYWKEDEIRSWLKVVAIHHNPVAMVPENVDDYLKELMKKWKESTKNVSLTEDLLQRFAADTMGLKGREYLQVLSKDCEVQLVLHGHHHAAEQQPWSWERKGQTYVLSAGSLGLTPDKLPGEQPNMIQLILLNPVKEELWAWFLVYNPQARPEGVVSPGRFVPDPTRPSGYHQSLSLPEGFPQDSQLHPSIGPTRDYSGSLSESRHSPSSLQLLSEKEIQQVARNFFEEPYGEDIVQDSLDRFLAVLKSSTGATDLGRTHRFLDMMLRISHLRPLPGKRHQLYQEYIETLLTALPNQQEQWCPEDREQRLRAVAHLAFKIQEKQQGLAVLRRDEIVKFLPEGLSKNGKGFLAWLAGPAGLLKDYKDGTLSFAHLSFQQYLSARYLFTMEDNDEKIMGKMEYEHWWETLRLWGAMVEYYKPERLEMVLWKPWKDKDERFWLRFWLTGTMLADGLGGKEVFKQWFKQLVEWLQEPWLFEERQEITWSKEVDFCVKAWAGSLQAERRKYMDKKLNTDAPNRNWLQWIRYQKWVQDTNPRFELTHPREKSNARVLIDALDGEIASARQVAVGRVLCGGSPFWPGQPWELVLLQTWPLHRRLVGHRLQSLANLSGGREQLLQVGKAFLKLPRCDDDTGDWARSLVPDFARYLDNDLKSNLHRYLADKLFHDLFRESVSYLHRYLVSELDNDLARELASNLVREFVQNLAQNLAQSLTSDMAKHLARDWIQYLACNLGRDLDSGWARDLELEDDMPFMPHFAIIEYSSLGRVGLRAFLAHLELEPKSEPAVKLISQACRLSLQRKKDLRAIDLKHFKEALKEYPPNGEPFWLALAKHLARCSTEEDRALLDDLAQHPEKREPPLQWGLKYIVRGDVVLDDGTEVTLDELTGELEMEPLPYLGEMQMPDEFKIDWEY